MKSRVQTHDRSDLAKLLAAIVAVLALVSLTYLVLDSDDSSAAMADGKTYYYNQLTPLEKDIVDHATSIVAFNHPGPEHPGPAVSFTLPFHSSIIGMTSEDAHATYSAALDHIMYAIPWEHVDQYYHGSHWSFEYVDAYSSEGKITSGSIKITIYQIVDTYGTDLPSINTEMNALKTFIDGYTVPDTANSYRIVRSIHEYICNNLTYYPREHVDPSDPSSPLVPIPEGMFIRNAATALIGDHVVVCEGYAKAFKALCDKYDVPCIIVTGSTDTDEPHMWNYVQMGDEKWYLVDCTWDDQSTMVNTYFLVGSESIGFDSKTIATDHVPDTADKHSYLKLPTLSTTAFDYSYYDDHFEIQFVDWNGTVINKTSYEEHATISIPPNPTRAADNTYTYPFYCWSTDGTSPATITTAEAPTTYTALYTPTFIDYEIKFFDTNGTTQIGDTLVLHFNDTITDPALPANYLLIEWEDYSATVTGNMNIKAVKTVTNISGAVTYNTVSTNVVIGGTELTVAKSSTKPLTINLASGTVVFDDTAKQALAADQTLTLEEKSFAILRSSVQSALKNAVVYSITFGTNNSVFEAGKATVSLNFTPRAGQDASNIMLYYVDGDKITEVPSSYADNKLTFTTNHFSTYAIQIPQETPDMVKLIQENWILIAILVFAIIGMALSYKFS